MGDFVEKSKIGENQLSLFGDSEDLISELEQENKHKISDFTLCVTDIYQNDLEDILVQWWDWQ